MSKEKGQTRIISLELSETIYALLEVLGEPTEVIMQLIDHAQKGVYRSLAWERNWLCQAFGYDWRERLETGDPYGSDSPMFQKPKGFKPTPRE